MFWCSFSLTNFVMDSPRVADVVAYHVGYQLFLVKRRVCTPPVVPHVLFFDRLVHGVSRTLRDVYDFLLSQDADLNLRSDLCATDTSESHNAVPMWCGVWLVVRRRRACNEWYVL